MSNDIKKEFVFGTYTRRRNSDKDDLVLVKEKIHFPDGTVKNNLNFIYNYERKFYVTKSAYRNHEQKKEFEEIINCDEYACTQAEMTKKSAKLLGMWGARRQSDVNESPYIYGTDITTPVLIHNDYRTKWPDLQTPSSLAIMDFETDVVHGHEHIISGSITFKDKVCIACTKDFLGVKIHNVEKAIHEAMNKHLSEYVKSRNIKVEIEIVDNPAQVAIALIKRAHEWQPDFLGFWNMPFDIGKISKAFDEYKIDPAFVFSDPSVPNDYKNFQFILGKENKTTATGKSSIKHIADLWHSVITPASFYCIDLMCLFKRLRVREKQRNSYKLDAILSEEINITKLRLDAAEGLEGLEWHYLLQTAYQIDYLIYNIFDCISVELLDEKTNDVAKGLRAAADISEIRRLNSNPKRLSDAMHFELFNQGKIIGSVSANMADDLCRLTPSMSGWIIALPAELQEGTGRRVILEYPCLETNIMVHSWDSDLASGYPTFGNILNVSKGTSRIEVCGIEGLKDIECRAVGINMSAIKTNAVEICQMVYDYPSMNELYTAFMQDGVVSVMPFPEARENNTMVKLEHVA